MKKVLLTALIFLSSTALAQSYDPNQKYTPNGYPVGGPAHTSPTQDDLTMQKRMPWKPPSSLTKTPDDANQRYRNPDGTYGQKRNQTKDIRDNGQKF